jgi:hypothetical protein
MQIITLYNRRITLLTATKQNTIVGEALDNPHTSHMQESRLQFRMYPVGPANGHFVADILGVFFISGVGLTSPGTAATSGLLYSHK